jgi:D-xylose transport system ATP-binding protein
MTGVTTPVLDVSGATKRFGAVTALDDVSIDVARGEVVALLGDNGAGKSTLIKAISGVHRLDSGRITLDGADITHANATSARGPGPVRQSATGCELLRRP